MTTLRWMMAAVIGAAALAGLTACTSPGEGAGQKLTRQPKAPPLVPPIKAEPRDEALAALATKELLAAAKSENPLLRAHALEGIKLADLHQGYPAILGGLDDPAALVRFSACMAAGELRLPQARQGAKRLLDDPYETVRLAAIYLLHRLGDNQYSHTLERTAVSPDMQIRANTAMVLGMLGEPSARKILTVMLRDISPAVRLQAAEAMWRLRDGDALEYLITATISRYPDDQMIACLALAGPRDQGVIEHLRGMLVTPYTEVNLVAARALGMVGSDEGYGTALAALPSHDARQRQLAAMAFGAIGRMDAQRHLRKLLTDAEADVRLSAAGAVLQLN